MIYEPESRLARASTRVVNCHGQRKEVGHRRMAWARNSYAATASSTASLGSASRPASVATTNADRQSHCGSAHVRCPPLRLRHLDYLEAARSHRQDAMASLCLASPQIRFTIAPAGSVRANHADWPAQACIR